MLKIRLILALTLFSIQASAVQQHHRHDYIRITGSVTTGEKEAVEFATVYLKGTGYGAATAADGTYGFGAPAGNYTLVVSAVGYQTVERSIGIVAGRANRFDIPVTPEVEQLDEVVVSADGITRVKRSAYNAVAIDTKSLQNTTLDLSGALAKAPGVKLRESGGVGSDMRYTLDGFGGKHIKVFIDGVPQEGVGTAFGLNTIPVNFAERIEVYKGVVPVGFGTDALGGVINVVTGKAKKQRFVDASFSYGSFGTHKVYLNAGQTFKNGLTYQVNAFRNYSRNDYHIDVAVEEFLGPDYTDGSRLNSKNIRRVKRFHDNYHNEAIVVKAGIVDKKWADRLLFGATYAHFYKEIQTGIIQKVVFGGKHRKGYSVMPSMEYSKRGLFTKGLDVSLTANYNRNITRHIDTASYRFNWRAEKQRITSPGEQSYQNTHSKNANLNATFTANYRFSNAHAIVLNHVWSSFRRENSATAGSTSSNTATAIPKETRKNISGLAYRLTPSERWNLSIFGKYYNLFNAGPLSTSTSGSEVFRAADTMGALGYGAAGTYFILKPLQAKLSFERAYRLPTNEEVFGDEDMELGTITLRPELSDNYNFNLSYGRPFGDHAVFIEGGLILRNTKDYIQRRIGSQSGGKTYATYENHGRVATKGFTLSANYNYRNRVSAGGSLTKVDVRDNVRTVEGGSNQVSVTYGARMPNVPYLFANADATLYLHDLRKKGNTAVIAYEMTYLHSFPLYSEVLGNDGGYMVPAQLAHNISLSYSVKGGRYNLSIECRNILDERLYDNFSLQKAGRAFYGKVRVYFGNN
jgi:outer membrane receptor protein involved in Fe transport